MAGFYIGCFVGAFAVLAARWVAAALIDSLNAAPSHSRYGAGLEDD